MNKIDLRAILLLGFAILLTQSVYVITDFGALAHQDHVSAHKVNAKAFMTAVLKANATLTE